MAEKMVTKRSKHRPAPNFHVRKMTTDDIPAVLDVWRQNNLHEGTYTIQSFMFQDPDGFFVAESLDDVDDHQDDEVNPSDKNETKQMQNSDPKKPEVTGTGGKILGMCAGVFVHPTIAFIGLYGVRPSYHGRGIGIRIWSKMMEHVGRLNAGLYAVPEHLAMYRDRAGFHQHDERWMFVYESGPDDPVNVDILVPSIRDTKISRITMEWYQRIIDYDSNIHGYIRRKLLPRVFTEEDTAAFVASDNDGTEIFGYGCIRTNNIGKAMIGPVYADNDAVAELLMRYLFTALPVPFAAGLLYMTLDSNPGGERIAAKLGLKKHEEIPRFFRHEPYSNADWNRVYCIHSPNFSLL